MISVLDVHDFWIYWAVSYVVPRLYIRKLLDLRSCLNSLFIKWNNWELWGLNWLIRFLLIIISWLFGPPFFLSYGDQNALVITRRLWRRRVVVDISKIKLLGGLSHWRRCPFVYTRGSHFHSLFLICTLILPFLTIILCCMVSFTSTHVLNFILIAN